MSDCESCDDFLFELNLKGPHLMGCAKTVNGGWICDDRCLVQKVPQSIDNRLRIIHNLLTEAATHPKATSDTLYRLIGARNALISLRERLIRESA